MNNYSIRQATIDDVPFLTEVVIASEKSNSSVLSFSKLFNCDEETVTRLITDIFLEEIDGCEFSISSFLIIDYQNEPVASFGGWIEAFDDEMDSNILKSNLLGYYFGKDAIRYLMTKSAIIKDLIIQREKNTLQLEYLYIRPEHRGKKLAEMLINEHVNNAKNKFSELQKAQLQVYQNNIGAIKTYEKCNFNQVKTYTSNTTEILNYLPFNTKCLMEKIINN